MSKTAWSVIVFSTVLLVAGCDQENAPSKGGALAINAPLNKFSQEITMPEPLMAVKVKKMRKVNITVKNVGTEPWSSVGDMPVNLSYHWIDSKLRKDSSGIRTPLPNKLNPGESITLSAELQGPAIPGQYTLRWTMVQETVRWFDEAGANYLEMSTKVER